MLFNSLSFILFAALFFLGWPLAKRHRLVRFVYIVVFSLFFYGWANPWNICILLLCVSVDFVAGLLIQNRPGHKRFWMLLSIGTNLFVLCFFKYSFFLAQGIGLPPELTMRLPLPHQLPLGISFFTFQSMTYAIDVYRGKITPTRNYLHYLAFTVMFPHLLAGPIVRASHLLPQLNEVPETSWQDRREGLWRIVLGCFRKMVVADNLAPAVGAAFASGVVVNSAAYWWVIMTMFAIQLYCDFAGYSEIARGLAKWMGYDFPVNFNSPFDSTSFRELWSRWHISLSTWFRDYVFQPLTRFGKRGGWLYANLVITMTLSGIWHGSGWSFAVWGLWNGGLLALERATHFTAKVEKIPFGGRFAANAIVLGLMFLGMTAFRSESFEQALAISGRMIAGPAVLKQVGEIDRSALLILCLCFVWHCGALALKGVTLKESTAAWLQRAAIIAMAALVMIARGRGHDFVYFQF